MRKIWIMTVVLLAALVMGSHAYAAAKDTLSAEDARVIMNELIPNVKILYVKQAPVAGLWEVGVEAGGRKNVLYLDHAKKHLVSGNIVSLKDKINLTQESFQKINKVDVSKISLKDALVLGEKTAKNKIIVFDDPD
jgi:thiol:disulfide interchange protein DsbC